MLAHINMYKEQTRKYTEYYENTTLTLMYTSINELKSLSDKEDNYPNLKEISN